MSANQFKSPVVRWIDHRLPVFSMLHHTAHDYPTPKNLNYMWNFGSLAGLSLAIMIVTGIVLAMSYTAHVDYAFLSVERIISSSSPTTRLQAIFPFLEELIIPIIPFPPLFVTL